jgi:hypothetical protein
LRRPPVPASAQAAPPASKRSRLGSVSEQLDRLDLPALLKLQTQVREALASRFESQQALVCVELADVDFRTGPPESGLHKRCYDLLGEASTPHNGRIFATQGDSMRACYPSGKAALRAVLSFIDAVTEYNYDCAREDQIMVSIGLRFLGSEQGHSARDAVTLQHAADPGMATITLHEAAGGLDDSGEASGEPSGTRWEPPPVRDHSL